MCARNWRDSYAVVRPLFTKAATSCGSEPCSPGISQANCLRLIKTGRHATYSAVKKRIGPICRSVTEITERSPCTLY
jgi:hypothetical protein